MSDTLGRDVSGVGAQDKKTGALAPVFAIKSSGLGERFALT